MRDKMSIVFYHQLNNLFELPKKKVTSCYCKYWIKSIRICVHMKVTGTVYFQCLRLSPSNTIGNLMVFISLFTSIREWKWINKRLHSKHFKTSDFNENVMLTDFWEIGRHFRYGTDGNLGADLRNILSIKHFRIERNWVHKNEIASTLFGLFLIQIFRFRLVTKSKLSSITVFLTISIKVI